MTLQKYSEMKDSGIEWIGEIPNQWEIRKIKNLVYPHRKVTYGIVQPGVLDKNGVLLIRGRDYISGWNTKGDIFKVSKELHQKFIRAKVISGDVLMCIVGATTGAVNQVPNGIIEANITQTTARIACDQSKMISKFMLYSLDSSLGKIQVANNIKGAAQPGLNLVMVENFIVCFPKILEQKQIVYYLDKKTKNVDNEISKNQKLIKLLKEKKQSVINHAVIQGLDDTVLMKNSGIQWIGEIPEHWNINKIKFTSYVKGRIGYHGLRSEEFTTKGPYLITGTDFIDGKIDWLTCNHVEFWRYEQNPYIQINKNDILITKDGTIGKVAFIDNVPDQTTLNSGVMVIRPLKKKYDSLYMYWTLKSNQFIDFIDLIKQGSTIQHLYQETFKNFQFVLPDSIEEQKQIVTYLDEKTKKADSLIFKVESQIQKLKQLRESLISSAVTGKICVTN